MMFPFPSVSGVVGVAFGNNVVAWSGNIFSLSKTINFYQKFWWHMYLMYQHKQTGTIFTNFECWYDLVEVWKFAYFTFVLFLFCSFFFHFLLLFKVWIRTSLTDANKSWLISVHCTEYFIVMGNENENKCSAQYTMTLLAFNFFRTSFSFYSNLCSHWKEQSPLRLSSSVAIVVAQEWKKKQETPYNKSCFLASEMLKKQTFTHSLTHTHPDYC